MCVQVEGREVRGRGGDSFRTCVIHLGPVLVHIITSYRHTLCTQDTVFYFHCSHMT